MYQVGVAIYIDGRGRCRMSAVSTSVPLRIRSDSIGPTLSLRDSTVRVIPDSFSVGETEKSNIGSYTIYKVQFKVSNHVTPLTVTVCRYKLRHHRDIRLLKRFVID